MLDSSSGTFFIRLIWPFILIYFFAAHKLSPMEPFCRKKYDSLIVWLYITGREKLLPEAFRKSIPHSTLSTWRNMDYASYHGHEFRYIQEKGMEWFELYSEHKRLERLTRTIARVWISVSGMVMPILAKSKDYEEKLMNGVQRLFSVLPKKTVLKMTGIPSASFHYRLSKLKRACGISPFSLCMKRHPMQLCVSEVRKINELMAGTETACWPAVSLYYKALRENTLTLSLSTFYKYVSALGVKRNFKKTPQKRVGLKSLRPNEYLHVDTTYVELAGGIKAAAVFVSDNFSKAVLGWSINLGNSARNVKNALAMAMLNIKTWHPNLSCATLVADGGSENHAVTVNEYLESENPPDITKVIALRDISFSNSPAEAVNKIMKRYIRKGEPETLSQLKTLIEEAVYDYSFVRPHGSLNGFTPMEVYTNDTPSMDFSARFALARVERMKQNRKTECGKC